MKYSSWLWLTASGLLLGLLVGCQPIQAEPHTPAPVAETANNEEETMPHLTDVLTGTVTYRQRIALPPGRVIEVQLQDVSRADAAAEVLATQTITTSGKNVPIPFELTYDPAQVDERFSYALSVRITVDGQLTWINTEHHAVLTRGAPTTGVEVVVAPTH
jgi:uncharacterized lipoprotein YbaY